MMNSRVELQHHRLLKSTRIFVHAVYRSGHPEYDVSTNAAVLLGCVVMGWRPLRRDYTMMWLNKPKPLAVL